MSATFIVQRARPVAIGIDLANQKLRLYRERGVRGRRPRRAGRRPGGRHGAAVATGSCALARGANGWLPRGGNGAPARALDQPLERLPIVAGQRGGYVEPATA
jgi:hypothetical protein